MSRVSREAAARGDGAPVPAREHLGAERSVVVREIRPADARAYCDVLDRTSDEDRYCRFFHVVNHFDVSDVARFVEPRDDTIGYIAHDERAALGVAHAFLTDGWAEVAIVVAADARRRGVGRALFMRLFAALRARGCADIRAISLSNNGAFAQLAKTAGMVPAGEPGDVIDWRSAPPA